MDSLQPVLAVLARVLVGFAAAFLVPLAWAVGTGEMAEARVWAGGLLLTGGVGLLMRWVLRHHTRELLARDGFLLVTLVWIVLPACAAVPLMFTVPRMTWAPAYFEAMSALTATGATALIGLDGLPVSVNVWRCFLQYIGGLGIILLVVAVLPLLGLGGMQLYRAETPGPLKDDKLTPRIAETARGLWTVYFMFSVACLVAYRVAGMSWADAFMHMCTTMGLGGFSPHDKSFAHWDSPAIEAVAIVFMTLAGVSFLRYFAVWRNRSLGVLARDAEVRSYVTVLVVATVAVTVVLVAHGNYDSYLAALRVAAFHVVSLATTTGYASTDYALWPAFGPVLMIFLGCFASCAGSTGGGIKMVRMLLLLKQARRELVRITHPRAVNPVTLGGGTVPATVIAAVLAYMLIYGASIVGLTLVMLLSGLDLVTAFSAVIVCVNNIGPGLGSVGPAGHFGVLNDFQLWVLSFGMLLGRLELMSVLVLLTPQFWRK
ncbi:TrkH family potassium uptake protein [Ramlibacter sp. USB13]|uniref:Trk system potassium uptake protein n=1 Tax=Ramlibacter cellulosilyticus TaxID=2764187 RepID=A0A923MNJ3_9BURK|nr:potassium transporter TrkG [Ramlibacter cellulosilyticus]MBC5782615.1 TrkH family potassium uptake protein [Ramlibacter cellulosilyticus]